MTLIGRSAVHFDEMPTTRPSGSVYGSMPLSERQVDSEELARRASGRRSAGIIAATPARQHPWRRVLRVRSGKAETTNDRKTRGHASTWNGRGSEGAGARSMRPRTELFGAVGLARGLRSQNLSAAIFGRSARTATKCARRSSLRNCRSRAGMNKSAIRHSPMAFLTGWSTMLTGSRCGAIRCGRAEERRMVSEDVARA